MSEARALTEDEAGAELADRLAESAANKPPVQHGDGIWFGLDEDEYHRDPALGSSDMKGLAKNPSAWWWRSQYNLNPDPAPAEEKPALVFGSAVHKYVLEGRDAFEAIYAPFDGDRRTKAGKAAYQEIVDAGKTCLPLAKYRRAAIAGQVIRSNPHLGKAFEGGAPEVSIFWTHTTPEGFEIRKKCRVDYLKIRSMVDLKSIREQDEKEFPAFVDEAIARHRYYVQLAHYWDGRERLPGLVKEGKIFGECDRAWLAKVAAQKEYFWFWVFYQSTGAPECHGTYSDKSRKLYDMGRSMIALAEHNYRQGVETFGLDGMPWIKIVEPSWYDEDSQPAWSWR